MKKLLTIFLLLVASSPLFAQKGRCWQVSNQSNPAFNNCPYQVTFSMALVYTSNNQAVPNSGYSVFQTINTGASASFCYPQTVPTGQHVVVTGINFTANGIQYNLPLTETIIYDAAPCTSFCNVMTYWQPVNATSYLIMGDCIIGG